MLDCRACAPQEPRRDLAQVQQRPGATLTTQVRSAPRGPGPRPGQSVRPGTRGFIKNSAPHIGLGLPGPSWQPANSAGATAPSWGQGSMGQVAWGGESKPSKLSSPGADARGLWLRAASSKELISGSEAASCTRGCSGGVGTSGIALTSTRRLNGESQRLGNERAGAADPSLVPWAWGWGCLPKANPGRESRAPAGLSWDGAPEQAPEKRGLKQGSATSGGEALIEQPSLPPPPGLPTCSSGPRAAPELNADPSALPSRLESPSGSP